MPVNGCRGRRAERSRSEAARRACKFFFSVQVKEEVYLKVQTKIQIRSGRIIFNTVPASEASCLPSMSHIVELHDKSCEMTLRRPATGCFAWFSQDAVPRWPWSSRSRHHQVLP